MKTVWVLCDKGKIGTYRQCLALSEWLEADYGVKIEKKWIELKKPYRWFPPQLMTFFHTPDFLQKKTADSLQTPYPDLVLAGGRQAVNAAVVLSRFCPTVVLQNPRCHPRYFTLVIPPHHDGVSGNNVLSTLGALHPIRLEHLQALRQQHYQGPTISVLIGGNSQHYRYTSHYMTGLADCLHRLAAQGPWESMRFLITPSRRTPTDLLKIFQQQLQGLDYEIWDGQGENPYLRYLACADALVVTGDSISMMSEVCITGKPVYIYEISHKSQRLHRFLESLYEGKYACPLTQDSDWNWQGNRLDELERLKPLIKTQCEGLIK